MSIESKIGCVNHDCEKCNAEKQEPVAYQNTQEKCRIETVPAQGGLLSTMQEGKDFAITHPPKQWVGLTDEEMHECWDSPLTPLGMKHVRMIEAKLKEKNT